MEQLTFSWPVLAVIAASFLFIGKMWGDSKRGFKVFKTNELPFCHFKVIFKDQKRTLLAEIGPKERDFLITTQAFGGKAIRTGEVVKHFSGSWKQQKALGLPNLGYAPLVKVEETKLEEEQHSETIKS